MNSVVRVFALAAVLVVGGGAVRGCATIQTTSGSPAAGQPGPTQQVHGTDVHFALEQERTPEIEQMNGCLRQWGKPVTIEYSRFAVTAERPNCRPARA